MARSTRFLWALCLAALIGTLPAPLWAQGGPPLVTDDPDTPPDGHWEINLAAIGSRTPGVRQLSIPDADINYGWGDHIQLKLDTPWLLSQSQGDALQSGLGASELGVKWRFVDQKTAGFSMSTYPQLSINFAPSSYRRGLTQSGKVWFLPLEASTEVAGFGLDGEVGRYRSTAGPDAWAAGLIVSRGCAAQWECLLEIRETVQPRNAQTLFNIGGRRKINESLALLLALGRDAGPSSPNHQSLLFYVGVQVLR
jgi:hypothetical protein